MRKMTLPRFGKRAGLITAITFALAALAGCGDSGTRSPETLYRGNSAEPSSLDPHRTAGTWESHILRDMFLGLMTDSAAGDTIYGAAESYVVSEDGKTYTFTIREGHKWSDGVPVTAEDFVFAFRRVLDPLTAAEYAAILYPIKNAAPINAGEMETSELGVQAVDDRTLVIELEYPAPFLPEMLTHTALYPVPKHAVEEYGDDWVRSGQMVSNGAYKLVEWRPNDYVHLEKNEHFYDFDNVAIKEIYYYPTNDAASALRRFRAGELDMNSSFPIQQVEWLKENLPEETRIHPFILTNYSVFNTERPPFDDKRIRQALVMTVDRNVLATQIMRTDQQPAYALVPPSIVNYPHTAQFEWKDWPMEQRIETAQQLMREAGYGPDNPLQFEYRYRENVDNKRVAIAVASMWKEHIWVDADIINTEPKTHYADLRSGNFFAADAGWVADYNDPKNYLFLLESATGQLNYGNYNNPEYDALLAQADQTIDIEERGELLSQAEQIMLNDAPLMPILFGTSRNLVAKYVNGYVDNPDDEHPTRFLSIDAEKLKN